MRCQYCKNNCVKHGKQASGVQRYLCKSCKKSQQEEYVYKAWILEKRKLVTDMLVNNAGFAGIARVTKISKPIVKRIILKEGRSLKPPATLQQGLWEVDEMRAYKKLGKDIWVVYAIERKTGKKIGISVGKRDLATLRKTINAVLMTNPKRIYTDGYHVYKSIIPKFVHIVSKKMLWRIERLHLTARNGLKMLNRKTLSFVRKPETLLACLKILFWSKN